MYSYYEPTVVLVIIYCSWRGSVKAPRNALNDKDKDVFKRYPVAEVLIVFLESTEIHVCIVKHFAVAFYQRR